MKRPSLLVALVSSGGLLLTALLSSAPSLRVVAQADVIDDSEAYAVYAAVLPRSPFRSEKPTGQIALLDETRAGMLDSPGERMPVEWRPVLESFRSANSRVWRLQPGRDLGVAYTFVTWTELSHLMQAAGYDLTTFCCSNAPGAEVFNRLPGGKLVAVSAVGFNAEKTRAMVTVQYDCFPLQRPGAKPSVCQAGGRLALEKQADHWAVAKVDFNLTWIASAGTGGDNAT